MTEQEEYYNERFVKIAVECGLLNYVDLETPRDYFIPSMATEEDVMTFARRIIEEIDNQALVGFDDYCYIKNFFEV